MVRKGEIACYKQFLLFSPCFPQLYTAVSLVRQNAVLCGNGLRTLSLHRKMKYGKPSHTISTSHEVNVLDKQVWKTILKTVPFDRLTEVDSSLCSVC